MTGQDANETKLASKSYWSKRTISVSLLLAAMLIFLILLPQMLLMIFAGMLFAVLLRSCGVKVGALLSIGPTWGVVVSLVGILALMLVFGTLIAPAVGDQIDELQRKLPETVSAIMDKVKEYSWGRQALDQISAGDVWSLASGGTATRAVGSLFGSLGTAVLLLFIGLYGAFDPQTYRRGFLSLFAPSIRGKADSVLSRSVETLQSWLSAQLISMTIVGVLTGLGLWVIGVPLALALGLIAGLLAFIPNLGPVLAATPGILLAVPDGINAVLLVLAVYMAVQTLESYVVTPLLQKEKVALPPLIVLCAQFSLGSLYGIMGLAVATPLTAVVMQLVRDLYVRDYLGHEARRETLDVSANDGGGDFEHAANEGKSLDKDVL
ncbi:MAG: AI-2E family transporter [Rhizobium sp.]|nr:AI-2E family transporter [Rhizobium sp.]